MNITSTTNYRIWDRESDVSVNISVDDDVLGISLNDPTMDSATYFTRDQARLVYETMGAALGIVASSPVNVTMNVGEIEYAPTAVEPGLFTDPEVSLDYDQDEWNDMVFDHATQNNVMVTFLYQGERDDFPLQRRVVPFERDDTYLWVEDADEDLLTKRFRLDRIGSRALLVQD